MTWFWQGCTFMPTLALSKGKAEKGNTKNQHIIWRGLMADVLASVQWSGRGIGLWIPLVQLWMDLGDSGIFCLTDLPQLFSLSSLCSVYARHPFLPHSLFIMIFFNPTPVCWVLCFSANIEVLRTEDEYSLQECFQASIPCNSLCSWGFPEVLQEAEHDKHLLVVCLDCCSTFIIPWKVWILSIC